MPDDKEPSFEPPFIIKGDGKVAPEGASTRLRPQDTEAPRVSLSVL
jgi:hypothetical protein